MFSFCNLLTNHIGFNIYSYVHFSELRKQKRQNKNKRGGDDDDDDDDDSDLDLGDLGGDLDLSEEEVDLSDDELKGAFAKLAEDSDDGGDGESGEEVEMGGGQGEMAGEFMEMDDADSDESGGELEGN